MFKPLGECSTIFAPSLNTILIDLNKVPEPLTCVGHVLFYGATGGGWLTENVKFYFIRFSFLYDLPVKTHHFDIDKYK